MCDNRHTVFSIHTYFCTQLHAELDDIHYSDGGVAWSKFILMHNVFSWTLSKDWKMQYSFHVMCSIGVTAGLLQQSQLLLITVTVIKEFFSFG